MKFNQVTSLDGVIQEVERLTDLGYGYISGSPELMKSFTAMLNQDSRRILALMMKARNWQYDDGGNINLPQGRTHLSSGDAKYALPPEALTVQRVDVSRDGQWYKLAPLTKEMINQGLDEFMSTDGSPQYYRLINNTIELFPAPNYNESRALKVYFDRDVVDFKVSDTDKEVGFASHLHQLLPLKTAIRWLKTKQAKSASLPVYILDEQSLEADLKDHYASRFRDLKPKITRVKISYK